MRVVCLQPISAKECEHEEVKDTKLIKIRANRKASVSETTKLKVDSDQNNISHESPITKHKQTMSMTERSCPYWIETKYKDVKENNSALRLPSFCIGRRLSMLVFCVTARLTCTNIRNAQSCCERLAAADVDRCTAMKSECTIMVR